MFEKELWPRVIMVIPDWCGQPSRKEEGCDTMAHSLPILQSRASWFQLAHPIAWRKGPYLDVSINFCLTSSVFLISYQLTSVLYLSGFKEQCFLVFWVGISWQ